MQLQPVCRSLRDCTANCDHSFSDVVIPGKVVESQTVTKSGLCYPAGMAVVLLLSSVLSAHVTLLICQARLCRAERAFAPDLQVVGSSDRSKVMS